MQTPLLDSARLTHIVLDCELQDFLERVYRVLTAYWVPLEVPYVIVGREHDLDRVGRD